MTVDVFYDLLRLGSVGLVSGFFASFLANRDHRHRKWWEMRVAAYQAVIEALSDLVYYYQREYDAELTQQKLTEEFQRRSAEIRGQAFPKVRKAADSGAFLFSEKVNEALTKLMSVNEDEYHTYIEVLDAHSFAARECLKTVVACSKVDLQLR